MEDEYLRSSSIANSTFQIYNLQYGTLTSLFLSYRKFLDGIGIFFIIQNISGWKRDIWGRLPCFNNYGNRHPLGLYVPKASILILVWYMIYDLWSQVHQHNHCQQKGRLHILPWPFLEADTFSIGLSLKQDNVWIYKCPEDAVWTR